MSVETLLPERGTQQKKKKVAILPLNYGDKLRGITTTAEAIKVTDSEAAAEAYLQEHLNLIDESSKGEIPTPKGSDKILPSALAKVAMKLQTIGTEKVAHEKEIVVNPETLKVQELTPVVGAQGDDIEQQLLTEPDLVESTPVDEFGFLPEQYPNTPNTEQVNLGDRFTGLPKPEPEPQVEISNDNVPDTGTLQILKERRLGRAQRRKAAIEWFKEGVNKVKKFFRVAEDKRESFKEVYPNLEVDDEGLPYKPQKETFRRPRPSFEDFLNKLDLSKIDTSTPAWQERLKTAQDLYKSLAPNSVIESYLLEDALLITGKKNKKTN